MTTLFCILAIALLIIISNKETSWPGAIAYAATLAAILCLCFFA